MSGSAERIAALVVTRDRRDLLRESLTAVLGQSRAPDHVLVVDNASSDGTPAMVASEFPSVELVRMEVNGGGAGGFHRAVRAGVDQGFDWLWAMDDDTIPRPDALERLLAAGERAHGMGEPVMLASRVLWTDGRTHPMNLPNIDGRDPQRFIEGLAQGLPPLRWATFVSVLFRTDAVRRHRLPRKDFFLWSDDIDFTARILRRERGYFVPDSVALHKTKTAHNPFQGGDRFYYAVRNSFWVMRGDALDPLELIGHTMLLVGQSARYLSHERFRPHAFAILLRGLRDGVFKRAA